MPQFQLRRHDQQRHFDITRQGDRLHVSAGDISTDVHILYQNGREFLIEYVDADGTRQRIRLAGTRNGDRRQVWVEGRFLTVERVRQRLSSNTADQGSLVASIPAVVSQILVQPGDIVKAGDKLILLESMKMVIPIQAPYPGRVTRILCAAGASVPAGVPLVEIEAL